LTKNYRQRIRLTIKRYRQLTGYTPMFPPILDIIFSAQFILPTLFIGYVFGSIPFGLILTKAFGLGDIRNIGSGNIGATNVLRTGNKKLALLVTLCDMGKGLIPVLIVQQIIPDPAVFLTYVAALGALLGHIFPIWLKFKGGKGVATFFGVTLALNWMTFLAIALCWLAVARLSRISSLSALIAMAHAPFYAYMFGATNIGAICFAVFAAIIWLTHRVNIKRLLKDEESKIGKKAT